ncbi:HAD family hydrolase [Sulfurovum lithotrophicum]|uniref:HAD family hydrolase n=1 Tax=Sulfurovum lithotrophicum TaxID=206403 RepID=UPI000697B642|nr:HAD family hydrolase [Sulfurovum lithotrophicum]
MVIVFDLDDTLYDEVEFVKSGFKEIAEYLGNDQYYDFMFDTFVKDGSGKVFNDLIDTFDLDISLQKLIEIYRFHQPDINLPAESQELLKFSQTYHTALISDGYYLMQQNKFKALRLENYIDYPIFTDFHHTKKPELKPFEMVMEKFKEESSFVYVSDNPKKDFIAPNRLGWKSIRYKNPVGIYKEYDSDAMYEVADRTEIMNILKEMK